MMSSWIYLYDLMYAHNNIHMQSKCYRRKSTINKTIVTENTDKLKDS